MAGLLDSKQNGRGVQVVTGGIETQRGRGNQGRRNTGSPHSVPLPMGRGDDWGREGGDKNPPTAQGTREQGIDGGDGAERRDRTEEPDEGMDTVAGAGGARYPLKNLNSAVGATTK